MNRLNIADQNNTTPNMKPEEEDTTDITEATDDESSTFQIGDSETSSLSERSTTKVSFASIHIRDYNRIVGDHPDAKAGPPLAIGWAFVEKDAMDINTYEQQKAQAKENSDKPWMFGLRRMTANRRRDLLQTEFEIPVEELDAAEQQVQKVRKQRAQTNNQKKLFTRTEEMMQSAKRKLQRTFTANSQDKTYMPQVYATAAAPFPTLPVMPIQRSMPREISV